jgi:hypothetical protein
MFEPINWRNFPKARLLECPKTMTNGPCGGVTIEGNCEVDRNKLCVWYEASQSVPTSTLARHIPAPDWSQNPADVFDHAQDAVNIAALPHRDSRSLRSGSRWINPAPHDGTITSMSGEISLYDLDTGDGG